MIKVIEGHRRSWKVMEGHERSRKVTEVHSWSFDTILTFQVRKVYVGGWVVGLDYM